MKKLQEKVIKNFTDSVVLKKYVAENNKHVES